MKEKALFLFVLGYALSFLTIKNIFFLILNVILLIILIVKKKNYKFYLMGVLFLCLRLIFINNNYESDVNEKFLVILNKENYSIIMNSKFQQFVCYDLAGINDYSIININGRLIELSNSSNFDIFSFKEYLSYRNIKYEIEVFGLELVSNGDTFKPKIMEFLLKELDEKSKDMISIILFGIKEDSSLYNDLIKVGVVHLVVVSGFHFNSLEQVFNKVKIKWINYIMICNNAHCI
jgi:competence protein ComEC